MLYHLYDVFNIHGLLMNKNRTSWVWNVMVYKWCFVAILESGTMKRILLCKLRNQDYNKPNPKWYFQILYGYYYKCVDPYVISVLQMSNCCFIHKYLNLYFVIWLEILDRRHKWDRGPINKITFENHVCFASDFYYQI